jgi:hypothetical protein
LNDELGARVRIAGRKIRQEPLGDVHHRLKKTKFKTYTNDIDTKFKIYTNNIDSKTITNKDNCP